MSTNKDFQRFLCSKDTFLKVKGFLCRAIPKVFGLMRQIPNLSLEQCDFQKSFANYIRVHTDFEYIRFAWIKFIWIHFIPFCGRRHSGMI